MEKALTKSEYLAGPKYSLADCAVTPYANRLFDLGLLKLWASEAPQFSGGMMLSENASILPPP